MKTPTVLQSLAQASVRCEVLVPTCPAVIVMAQAALESGWLDYMSGENNALGIKAYTGQWSEKLCPTTEYFTDAQRTQFLALDRGRTATLDQTYKPTYDKHSNAVNKYHVLDWFASFATLADCFAYRANLFTRAPYAAIMQQYQQDVNLDKCVRAFAPIYATSPSYADTLLEIINDHEVQAALAAAKGVAT